MKRRGKRVSGMKMVEGVEEAERVCNESGGRKGCELMLGRGRNKRCSVKK
jgi:hypothetical protein